MAAPAHGRWYLSGASIEIYNDFNADDILVGCFIAAICARRYMHDYLGCK